MTERALGRLVDEESRLTAAAHEVAGAALSREVPDRATAVGGSSRTAAFERRLVTLRDVIASAEVVEATDTAVIGRRVAVADDDTVETYRLVIPGAGDPANGAISINSPLGAAVLGTSPGTRIDYQAPGGARTVTVTAVAGDEPPL